MKNVYFPSVTLCNINQGRNSLFRQFGLIKNESLRRAVLHQAYSGLDDREGAAADLSGDLEAVRAIFSSEDVVRYICPYEDLYSYCIFFKKNI